ncbi:disease resistance protein At4g27190-like [Fagus crenata]
MDRITEVKQKMEKAEKEGKDILPLVTWLKDVENLMDRITEVKQKIEAAVKEGEDITRRVETLLKDMEKLELKVKPIQEDMVNNREPSACFFNCSERYRASKEVEEILEEIRRLVQNIPDVVYSTTIPKVEYIPGPTIPTYNSNSQSGVHARTFNSG